MTRRCHGFVGRLGLGAVVWLAAILQPCVEAAVPAGDRPPNVILILADDMAVGDIAAFNGGRNATPHIDRLVKEGVWFNAAYSASPVCAPARAALLTGRYPHRTGVVTLEMNTQLEMTRIRSDETTIADVFSASGYLTGMIGKWHTGAGEAFHPLRRGFREFEGFFGSDKMTYSEYSFDVGGKKSVVQGQYLTENLSERAVAFVRRHQGERFFLHLAHYAPHRPIEAPAAAVAPYLKRGYDRNTATIYGMIEIMDRGIGSLIEELDDLGIREQTLIIFASDNGPDPIPGVRFNHGLRGTKYEINEGGIRVPLIFNWPRSLPPGERNATVHFADLFPTLVEICRLEPPVSGRRLDGMSLGPVLFDGTDTIPVPRFWQWNRAHPNYTHNAAMRDGPWKLVRPFVTRGENPPDSAEVPVLYHLETDPFETINLAEQHPERYAKMRGALEAWSREVERERQRRD